MSMYDDNCKLEFNYGTQRLDSKNLIPVVMEPVRADVIVSLASLIVGLVYYTVRMQKADFFLQIIIYHRLNVLFFIIIIYDVNVSSSDSI